MIFDVLNQLGIHYELINHDAYVTMEDALKIESLIDGQMCKNLFLRTGKKYYILVLKGDKRIKLNRVSKILEISHLHFGTEEELKSLNLYSGCVNPLSIVYDKNHEVTILLDEELVNRKLLFHPNDNTKTISIDYTDLEKYIQKCGNEWIVLNLQ